ncbi:hypothetical protein [Mycobacterium celatum]|uniref:Uncharacterized protein n=1 Tax=Mycobacterium celatum TaxID=28045 RepID=A0A1X1RNS6_MYCCE|nr:hypothetical protein [Mycobacterium celatum]ORV10303.1 hypothetical protein AWB95_15535 [Mycobacterium celatum]PIB78905.1 hypothetical protein CQY23_10770 [Mycobacterium celatum]
MSSWAGSARRAVVGAIGAGALSGAMLFGALPSAQAAPTAATTTVIPASLGNPSGPVAAGWHDAPMPEHWWRHHHRWWHHWWWWW